ncbi:protein MraZ [Pediococcus claussenii ATCC BAA-344]|uniref:Transcriptional regulator MraZ n=2 Tax=Pediococcus claussenii TaxID=187452 RepID=G8PCT8_PEDCP|nr:protein MraZ [Pediococcus claussenii ATCC BAA-344]KRN18934.1 mraZ protein [Pediococcus claussenii]
MGEYKHSIDTKGRLIVPSKFRDDLGDDFIITRGLDGCIFGYPLSEWKLVEEKLRQLPTNKRNNRAFVRFLFADAAQCSFDKQGRINIPKQLREHAGLSKSCVLVGVSNRFEIWDEDRWSESIAETEENFDDIAENLIDFGL